MGKGSGHEKEAGILRKLRKFRTSVCAHTQAGLRFVVCTNYGDAVDVNNTERSREGQSTDTKPSCKVGGRGPCSVGQS